MNIEQLTGLKDFNIKYFQDALPAINHRKDIDLDDIQLVNVATKTLNKILKKSGVSKDRAKEIKQDRRTLKNRGYAANCR